MMIKLLKKERKEIDSREGRIQSRKKIEEKSF